MTISKAIELYSEHLRTSVKKRTQDGYKQLIGRFQYQFSARNLEDITAEELCRFLETFTEGLARTTKRLRYAQLRAIFNFCIDTYQINIKNPAVFPIFSKHSKAYSRGQGSFWIRRLLMRSYLIPLTQGIGLFSNYKPAVASG